MLKELPYNYFQIILNSSEFSEEKLAYKLKYNPIKEKGRLTII